MAIPRLQFLKVAPEDVESLNPFMERARAAEQPGPFRVGELSRLSGVPVGTIKYYLREGLLPPGKATAKTQALYDADHLRRLRLVRALADVGRLSIAQIKGVVGVLDEKDDMGPGELEQLAGYALNTGGRVASAIEGEATEAERALADAREATDQFVDTLGFQVDPKSPARAELAEALAALRVLGFAEDPIVFYEHARVAYELGSFEIGATGEPSEPSVAVEGIMVGSVIFGAAFMALRRMTHEHETRRRLDIKVGEEAQARAKA